jgi:GNAT superfamily N-acetyltransferase
MPDFAPAVPLAAEHSVEEFDCGSPAETDWLRRSARVAEAAGTARTYVVTPEESNRVVGYYALAASKVEPANAPARLLKGAGRTDVPVILLARLGVDVTAQGCGLGRRRVFDALLRVVSASKIIGARALLIDAETEQAKQFYLHVGEFEESPLNPLQLCLLMKDLRRALKDAGVEVE